MNYKDIKSKGIITKVTTVQSDMILGVDVFVFGVRIYRYFINRK